MFKSLIQTVCEGSKGTLYIAFTEEMVSLLYLEKNFLRETFCTKDVLYIFHIYSLQTDLALYQVFL